MTQHARVVINPTPSATEIRLQSGEADIPYTKWPLTGHPGVFTVERWLLDGSALEDEYAVLVEHQAIARLSPREAAALELPLLTQLRAAIVGNGIFVRPDFTVSLRWLRLSGQSAPNIVRTGAWLREPDGYRRLPETLFSIAEAVSAHDAARGNEAARLNAVAALRRALPQASQTGQADAAGLLGTATIIEAAALSLDVSGEGEALRPNPVLHADGGEMLLTVEQQKDFAERQFHNWTSARNVYTLPGGVYVTVTPTLRTAMDVVKQVACRPVEERLAFLREPRGAIRAALGDEVDTTIIDRLVIETETWSDRVTGLGLWTKRALPWIAMASNDWFGFGAPSAPIDVSNSLNRVGPEVASAHDELQRSASGIQAATVAEMAKEGAVSAACAPAAGHASETTERSVEALLIKPNEQSQDIEALVASRLGPSPGLPACLTSTLKQHQLDGLAWLQRNWRFGSPGVLLADDMGLGKTLQGLAFLAWLREAMSAGLVERRPALIVAPTGLLYNWLKEHDHHLASPGLGEPVLAFGRDLTRLRSGGAALDRAILQRADWVLTTYETLRDYDRDFGGVHFAVMLMDEAQKVKTPGARMTDAAKAMRADFRIAMTGTPVENRLADLWCIVDGVAPGHLRDLRHFSSRFEAGSDPERMAELKASLDRDIGKRPALLLRRLKETELPGLPVQEEHVHRTPMTGAQLSTYEAALCDARKGDRRSVLETLQRIRSVSLRPGNDDDDGLGGDEALIVSSARLRVALTILDKIHNKRERALVFLEDLSFMARLSGLLQRRYRLSEPPMVINGTVAGAARQARVDRFQEDTNQFAVMILSPRAGGVGLTLTGANHVVHLTRWWNPAVEDQATARVSRIGQERPVSIHIPLACLPDGRRSFDENLHDLLARKRRLMNDALYPAEASSDELLEMLSDTMRG